MRWQMTWFQGKKNGLFCRLDMEKAYWHFVDHILNRMGFGSKWNIVCPLHLQVLVNGRPYEFFTASRGLRQGDPLSSLLFIFIMEALNGLICKTKELRLLKSVSVGKKNNSIDVSHLFLADDKLIFCQPDIINLLDLRCILLCFQAVSGLKRNIAKSKPARIDDDGDSSMFAEVTMCYSSNS